MSHVALRSPLQPLPTADESLLVTWQNPATRTYFLVGRLTHLDDGSYSFAYFREVADAAGFRPAPGFPDVTRTYTSSVLFPLFTSRLMSESRPDRKEWLHSHGLDEGDTPFRILGRTLGQRVGDQFEMYPEPHVDRAFRAVAAEVPIHGLRYHPEGLEALNKGAVTVGDQLAVITEPENPYDHRAHAVCLKDGTRLGFVPAPLLLYLERENVLHGTPEAEVVHVNPDQYGHHQRLILHVRWHL